MPNLKTDRTAGLALDAASLNVRRLMYQSLIWPMELGDEPRRLRPALDSQRVERAANPLIDGMRGNPEFHGDFF